jgi:hypothetical protein
MFNTLAAKSRYRLHQITATVVKAHRALSVAKGQARSGDGGSRCKRSSKVHAAIHDKGRRLNFVITSGYLHNSYTAEAVLATLRPLLAVTTDMTHDNEKVRLGIKDEARFCFSPAATVLARSPAVPSGLVASGMRSRTTSAASWTGGT